MVHLTWTTQVQVLVLVVGAGPQAPGVVGKGKQVFQSRRVSYGTVQALQPLLALLKCGEVAPVGGMGEMREEDKYKMMNFCVKCNNMNHCPV